MSINLLLKVWNCIWICINYWSLQSLGVSSNHYSESKTSGKSLDSQDSHIYGQKNIENTIFIIWNNNQLIKLLHGIQ